MREIKEDLTSSSLTHIAHGCNAQGKMGSGVAKAIRAKWPEAYSSYITTLDQFNKQNYKPLGMDFYVHTKDDYPKVIHNLITQEYYGRDGSKFARYIYVIEALEAMIKTFRFAKLFAVSRIGCSLGGLEWDFIREIYLELEERYEIEFWVYHIEVDPDA